ncbi:hypothetical protein THAOC_33032, partial [Thalassiosira oceanica]
AGTAAQPKAAWRKFDGLSHAAGPLLVPTPRCRSPFDPQEVGGGSRRRSQPAGLRRTDDPTHAATSSRASPAAAPPGVWTCRGPRGTGNSAMQQVLRRGVGKRRWTENLLVEGTSDRSQCVDTSRGRERVAEALDDRGGHLLRGFMEREKSRVAWTEHHPSGKLDWSSPSPIAVSSRGPRRWTAMHSDEAAGA